MKETLKLGFILLVITAVSAGVLATANNVTGPIIAEMERQESFGAFMELFTEADDFQPLEDYKFEEIKESHSMVREVFEAKKGDEVIGYALKTAAGGYGGDIIGITGINTDGSVAGIKIVSNSETPNIGTRILEEGFISSFKDKSAAGDLKAVGSPAAEDEVLLLSKSHIYETEKRAYGTIMFLSIFIGVLFFVTSGSFIYNKFYMDEEVDKQKYMQLNKIGLTYNEVKKIVTLEIGVLFLLPYVVAVIHSSLALTVLKNLFNMDVTGAAFIVMGSFLLVQILFFLFIRERFLLEIRDKLVN